MNGSRREIATIAIETRQHLISALEGLDRIIALANAASQDDIVAQARAARQPVVAAAQAFNAQGVDDDGNIVVVDPIVLNAADQVAVNGQQAAEELFQELSRRVDDLEDRIQTLENRVDGHDRRFENNESNLSALNGAVGIMKNPQGAWVPIPDGQFDRNSTMQRHFGYHLNDDGEAEFYNRSDEVSSSNQISPIWYGAVLLAALLIGVVMYFVLLNVVGLVPTIILAAAVAVILIAVGTAVLNSNPAVREKSVAAEQRVRTWHENRKETE